MIDRYNIDLGHVKEVLKTSSLEGYIILSLVSDDDTGEESFGIGYSSDDFVRLVGSLEVLKAELIRRINDQEDQEKESSPVLKSEVAGNNTLN